jgi:hypothetical protein
MNTYELAFSAECPNGALTDCYQIIIRSHRTIMVESIHEALNRMPKSIFQEDLATCLRNMLGAEITVIGWHHGIKITSQRS